MSIQEALCTRVCARERPDVLGALFTPLATVTDKKLGSRDKMKYLVLIPTEMFFESGIRQPPGRLNECVNKEQWFYFET